jgi:hypothetical protein
MPSIFSKKAKGTRRSTILEVPPTQRDNHAQRSMAIHKDSKTDIGSNGGDQTVRKSANKSKKLMRIHSDIREMKHELERDENKFDELTAATSRQKWLNDLKNRLEQIEASSIDEKRQCTLYHCLAMSYGKLGNSTEAYRYYRVAVPYVFFEPNDPEFNDISRFCTSIKNSFRIHHIGILLHYFELTIVTGRNLVVTERILGILPWLEKLGDDGSLTESETRKVTLLTIRVLNTRRNYEEAFKYLCKYNIMFGTSVDDLNTGLVALEEARVYASKESSIFRGPARKAFVFSITMCTILGGMWFEDTLTVLYHFGKALLHWGDQGAACRVLEECCLGIWYRFGPTHPYFNQAQRRLTKCKDSASSLRALEHLKALDDQERASFAYEHVSVDTVIDLLSHVPDVDFAGLEDALHSTYNSTSENRFAVDRLVAQCMEKRGDFQGALQKLKSYPSVSVTWDVVVQKLDRIRILSRDNSIDAASDEARILLHQIGTMVRGPFHQEKLKAVQRKLVTLGVTHLTFEQPSTALTLVGEQDSEILGTGTFALVHSVKVGQELYARKSIALPRFRQHQIREAIQNELSVTRKLVHPHTIRVFFTYEENDRFYILMDPVADFDLEAFLIQHSSKPPTRLQQKMILNWFCCLANTLAFIHSKGVRHKDIKPRNILVKGGDIIFADFGSSHVFLEDGGSTTEGPSYGHTKMYCAPEVISQGKRNRAADVFSLGCVFTELAVWLVGPTGLDIHSWHEHRATEIDHMKTNAYYASLDRVEKWFRTCAEEHVRIIYNHIICRMLCTDPDERLKPAQVTRLMLKIQNYLKIHRYHSWDIKCCSKCRLDLWLDTPDDTISVRSVVIRAENKLKPES